MTIGRTWKIVGKKKYLRSLLLCMLLEDLGDDEKGCDQDAVFMTSYESG